MREYRKRKRERRMSVPVPLPSPPSVVRALKPSWGQGLIIESSPQPAPPHTGFARQGAPSTFNTALELARPFPLGILASQVCPYCYDTGYSSPGTQCSYCRRNRS
jgi:hypothetical protein